jgi:glycogen synthase
MADHGVSELRTFETHVRRFVVPVSEPAIGHEVRRVGFLTPEFMTEKGATGGVGNYVLKMATALRHLGIESEVFVPSLRPRVIDLDGVRVEAVASERSWAIRAFARGAGFFIGPRSSALVELSNARRLARAMERRHAERAFDVVQSSNFNLTGAFVRPKAERAHLVRISTSRTLFDEAYGGGGAWASRLIERYDARVLRRADVAYAPSRLLADFFRRTYGLDVQVIRPPAELGAVPATTFPFDLPPRYLMHFGTLGVRKGTDLVARALPIAWQEEPELRMVWVGPLKAHALETYRDLWGAHRDHVQVLGTVEKSLTYGALQRAVAAVLPSTVDNLPNTVIESLILGVPVIGSDGASIDELVEDGVSGALVPIGDTAALAKAMVAAWRGRAPWLAPRDGGRFQPPASLDDLRPDRAVGRFLSLAAAARRTS